MKVKKGELYVFARVILLLCLLWSCKKDQQAEDARVDPPIKAYVVTARIDKKGTNSVSEGTGVLKGAYDEESKKLDYILEYKDIDPALITIRSGPKGSAGELIKEIFKKNTVAAVQPLRGSLTLTPLQERNLLKGLWFVAMGNLTAAPEISGSLTLKQK